jgi:hypothetical protein
MKTTSRATFVLSAVVAALLGITASTAVSAAGGPGAYLTSNGFRVPVYGTSQHQDADGNVVAECVKLTAPQIDAARIGRQLSRAMMALSPQAVVSTEGGATFEVTYTDAQGTGFNDAANGATRRRGLEAAAAAWSKVLKTTVPIKIQASMSDLDDGDNDPTTMILASASPTQVWIFDDTVVPSALLWQMLNHRQANADDSDITVTANALADWDYTPNGSVPPGRIGFVYSLMHEIGHGLGITDSFDADTGMLLNDPLAFGFDAFVNRGSTQRNRLLDHAPEERHRDMISNDLFFNGPNAVEASKKSIKPLPMVKLYAPSPYEGGSSVAHVDQELYADVRTGLMAPKDFGTGTDRIDILTLGIIKDLGYTMVPNPPLPPNSIPGTTTRVPQ